MAKDTTQPNPVKPVERNGWINQTLDRIEAKLDSLPADIRAEAEEYIAKRKADPACRVSVAQSGRIRTIEAMLK